MKTIEQQVQQFIEKTKEADRAQLEAEAYSQLQERDRIAEQRTLNKLQASVDDEATSCTKKMQEAYKRGVAEERERLLKIVRQTFVRKPELLNDSFIFGFSNCRQRIEKALTTPLEDPK